MGRGLVVLAVAATALSLAGVAQAAERPYLVGAATHSINPAPDGRFARKPVYLGGYGIGGGSPVLAGRPATGMLGNGLRSAPSPSPTATAPSRSPTSRRRAGSPRSRTGPRPGRHAQGGRAPHGGVLRAEDVVIQTTTATPGRMRSACGAACRTSTCVRADQTVTTIVESFWAMQPAKLYYGTAHGRDLLSNQFDYDEANKSVDSDVRVLQARDGDRVLATLLNFSAHTTVLGSGNTKASGDWARPRTRCSSSASAARP